MKVGDLVELSAYGRKLKWFSRGRLNHEDIGVLVAQDESYQGNPEPYLVAWNFGSGPKRPHLRRDLRIAKISKKSVASSG